MAVLQRMTMSRVVARPQEDTSSITKSARPCRRNTLKLGGNVSHTPKRREVGMIFGGTLEVGNGRRVQDRYSQKVKKSPQTMVHTTGSKRPIGYVPKLDDIFFT